LARDAVNSVSAAWRVIAWAWIGVSALLLSVTIFEITTGRLQGITYFGAWPIAVLQGITYFGAWPIAVLGIICGVLLLRGHQSFKEWLAIVSMVAGGHGGVLYIFGLPQGYFGHTAEISSRVYFVEWVIVELVCISTFVVWVFDRTSRFYTSRPDRRVK